MLDIAIIGAGYLGIWSSYLATKLYPGKRIAVFEKAEIGSGTSRYGLDVDFTNNANPHISHLSEQSRKLFFELKKDIPDIPYVSLNARVLGTRESFEKCNTSFDLENDKPDLLTGATAITVQPAQKISKRVRCYRSNDKSFINQMASWVAAQNSNYELFEKRPITQITFDPITEIWKLSTADRQIEARNIISTVGPWFPSATWQEKFDTQWAIKKVVCFELELPVSEDQELIYLLDEDAFLLPRQESNTWVLSISSQEWGCQPSPQLTADSKDRAIAENILDKYLNVQKPKLKKSIVFCDTYAQDRRPNYIQSNLNQRFIAIGGTGGSGFRLAPALADQALKSLMQ